MIIKTDDYKNKSKILYILISLDLDHLIQEEVNHQIFKHLPQGIGRSYINKFSLDSDVKCKITWKLEL